MNDAIFKAYDIRGIYPSQIDEASVKRIAMAYTDFIKPNTVAVGRDVRLSGDSLKKAVIEGLTAMGVNVIDIGVGPTELMYFAVGSLGLDGGIQVSASHNPAEYNGLKMVKKGVEALSAETGLTQIKETALSEKELGGDQPGSVSQKDVTADYLEFIAKQVDLSALKPLTLVANGNFGMSGVLAKQLIEKMALPIALIPLNLEPDGSFPKGRPDPLIKENRAETSALIVEKKADMGVAWDADGDRCYVADEHGEFLEGCYMTALLARQLLKKSPGSKVIYDPRNIYAAQDIINKSGGVPIMSKTGHALIKNRMKQEGALFAGEMSGHYYYRDFYNADNGLLTFLHFLEILAQTGKKVSEIANEFRSTYHVSGEINFTIADPKIAIAALRATFPGGTEDTTDGLSVSFDNWRYNIRSSNTEPLVRLNVESTDAAVCKQKTAEIQKILEG